MAPYNLFGALLLSKANRAQVHYIGLWSKVGNRVPFCDAALVYHAELKLETLLVDLSVPPCKKMKLK